MQFYNSLSILFQSKVKHIPLKFDLLDNISPSVSHSLVFSPKHDYTVKSNVSEAVFESFLEYWLKGTPSDIQINNIDEFIQLNQEFQFSQLDTLIKNKAEEFGEDLQYFKSIKNHNHTDQSNSEEQIAKRLDDYLERYKAEIMKLPITSLYNIFNHHQRKLRDHNLAYDLIKIHFENTGDSNIFSLLPFLDGTKLSKENLNDSISSQESRFGFHPTIDVTYLTNAVEMQKKQGAKIIEIEETISKQQNQHNNFEQQISSLIEKLTQNIEELNKTSENQQKIIQELKTTIKSQSETIDKLNNTTENQQKIIQELKATLKSQSKTIDKLNNTSENQQKIIDESKTTIKIQSNTIDKLNNTSENQKEDIEKLNITIQSQEKSIEELNKKDIDKTNMIEKLISKDKEMLSLKNSHEIEIGSIISNIEQLKNEKIDRFFTVYPNLKKPGILGTLKEKEKSHFDPLFIASQSSNDIYNLIDPNSKTIFGTSSKGNFFMKFELQEPIIICGIKIFNSCRNFPRSFDIEVDGEIVKTLEDVKELNKKYKEMTINFEPIRGKSISFVQKGPNWDEENGYLEFKRIEILSNESKYLKGVFATLIGENNKDPHKSGVYITSACFDFNSFYLLNSKHNIWSIHEENSWFQVELTQGSVILFGFRLKRYASNKMKNYKIIATYDSSNPAESWSKLYEVNEQSVDEHKILDIYEFDHPSLPVRFIRIVQLGESWSNEINLAFFHFDLFGCYMQ